MILQHIKNYMVFYTSEDFYLRGGLSGFVKVDWFVILWVFFFLAAGSMKEVVGGVIGLSAKCQTALWEIHKRKTLKLSTKEWHDVIPAAAGIRRVTL